MTRQNQTQNLENLRAYSMGNGITYVGRLTSTSGRYLTLESVLPVTLEELQEAEPTTSLRNSLEFLLINAYRNDSNRRYGELRLNTNQIVAWTDFRNIIRG